MQELTKLVLRIQCPYCGEPPGEWCRARKSGKRAQFLHSDRGRAVYPAWWLGLDEGALGGRRQEVQDVERMFIGLPVGSSVTRYDLIQWARARVKQLQEIGA